MKMKMLLYAVVVLVISGVISGCATAPKQLPSENDAQIQTLQGEMASLGYKYNNLVSLNKDLEKNIAELQAKIGILEQNTEKLQDLLYGTPAEKTASPVGKDADEDLK
ncbi:MAG: hypothetical protein ABH825_00175 [Candidatus Omnitrophota bacterium]